MSSKFKMKTLNLILTILIAILNLKIWNISIINIIVKYLLYETYINDSPNINRHRKNINLKSVKFWTVSSC
jgi:lipid A disaccharide synthetase